MNLNKVMLAGNLTRDPEVRHTSGNTSVCSFGLAVNRRWKSADGEDKEEVTFVDCSAWGKTGETIAQYFSKGRPIYVEGRLKLDQWEADGQKRSKLSVTVESFQFVGKRDDGATPAPNKPAQGKLATMAGSRTANRVDDDPDGPPF